MGRMFKPTHVVLGLLCVMYFITYVDRVNVGTAASAKYSGTASGLMNSGSALAAIVSPLVAGYVIDLTGDWYLPFIMSMVLLGVGAVCALLMRPEQRFVEDA